MNSRAEPDRLQEILGESMRDLARGDAAAALRRLSSLAETRAREPMVQLHIALAHKLRGDTSAEAAALEVALTSDPYFYPALLQKGTLLERLGQPRAAARVFRNVLKIMPEQDKRNPSLQRALEHAEAAVNANQQQLSDFLDRELGALRAAHASENLGRFDESVQVMLGRKKAYVPEPVMFHFTQLPAIQFYDNALFPWIAELEAAADSIRDEIVPVIAASHHEFRPYINYPPGAPLNQWRELDKSQRWSTFFLWQNGARVDENCARCPATAALLEGLPLAGVPGFSPNVMFSCLDPRTHIPAHTGDTNTRLVVHLPLIVPPRCSFRVGNETREWRYGKAWVFDDTIEHEARNDSDELRVLLIFDVWNPLLTPGERELVAKLVNDMADFYRESG
jgi:aspartyl/asparaginyl beta-hydroxylase (cupin superfamily)